MGKEKVTGKLPGTTSFRSTSENAIEEVKDKDIANLPDNPERNYFRILCVYYWKATIDLVDEARRMQPLKESGRIRKNKENDHGHQDRLSEGN